MQFSKGALRHMKIRERKGPSQGATRHSEPHERTSSAPKFEGRSQEETLRRERCARRDALEMGEGILNFKEKDKSYILLTFGCVVSDQRHPQRYQRKENLW